MAISRQHGTPGELEKLAKNLRAVRKDKGWSQTELAKRAGVPLATLNNVELAHNWPSLGLYAGICRALGLGEPPLFKS